MPVSVIVRRCVKRAVNDWSSRSKRSNWAVTASTVSVAVDVQAMGCDFFAFCGLFLFRRMGRFHQKESGPAPASQ